MEGGNLWLPVSSSHQITVLGRSWTFAFGFSTQNEMRPGRLQALVPSVPLAAVLPWLLCLQKHHVGAAYPYLSGLS